MLTVPPSMRFGIDSGKLLYALGVLFAAAALLYFVRDVVFGLSITVKAALLFVLFVGCFVGGLAMTRDILDVIGFALSGIAYVVFVGYVVVRYDPGETGTFLLLALSAALFVGLGYLLREVDVSLSRRTASSIGLALLVASSALVAVDAVGGGVSYELTTEDRVTVTPQPTRPGDGGVVARSVSIGAVTASNDFVFTRALDLPSLAGCVVGGPAEQGRDLWVGYNWTEIRQDDVIRGGQQLSFRVEADLLVDTNRTEPLTYDVSQGGDCDATRDRPTLLVRIVAGPSE